MFRSILKRALSRLPPRQLERALAYGFFQRYQRQCLETREYVTRHALWDDLFARVRDVPVCCLEFGVYQGRSLAYFATLNDHPSSRFFGFDSFEGLPESWTSESGRGAFSTYGKLPEIPDSRVTLVPGWFNETLPQFLAKERELLAMIASGAVRLVVHLDADLFSSTLYALMQIAPCVPEFLFVFDEFIGDESRALYYATGACGLSTEFYGHTRQGQGYPMVASGRIANAAFEARQTGSPPFSTSQALSN